MSYPRSPIRPYFAIPLLVALTGLAACQPAVIDPQYGLRCEGLGYRVGTNAYADCARKLDSSDGEAAIGHAPVLGGDAAASQVCDPAKPDDTPDSRYIIKRDLVFDQKTDLVWQRCTIGQDWVEDKGCVGNPLLVDWGEAKNGAKKGWRLPTLEELEGLASGRCRFPAINQTVFPGMDPKLMWYWSSTTNGDSEAWGVNFREGRASTSASSGDTGVVRLVRGEND